MTKTLHLRYFAILREQSGLSEETIQSDVNTPSALYEELAKQYKFTLPVNRVKAAVNDDFKDMNTSLQNGDTIIFIPPVAGG